MLVESAINVKRLKSLRSVRINWNGKIYICIYDASMPDVYTSRYVVAVITIAGVSPTNDGSHVMNIICQSI